MALEIKNGLEPLPEGKERLPVTAADCVRGGDWELKPGAGKLEVVAVELVPGYTEYQFWRVQ